MYIDFNYFKERLLSFAVCSQKPSPKTHKIEMKKLLKITTILLLTIIGVSCTNLDIEPASVIAGDKVFSDESSYRAFVAKLYAGLAVTGQQGPAGSADIQRQYWGAQELSTDEAVIGWGDAGLPDFHEHSWTAANNFLTAMYNRVFFQVSQANEFLRQTTEGKLSERNVSTAVRAQITNYRAEARFLRALSYWHGLDLFGSIPLYAEDFLPGSQAPTQATRQEIFTFIEREIQEIENDMVAPGAQEYGRASQAAAWMLMAKLYMNSEVYTGQARYTEAITYLNKIINSGAYSLKANFQENFMADNNTSSEIIFSIPFDGVRTRTWGGMTFLINASLGGSMNTRDFGMNGGWWGTRTTSAVVDLFPDATGTIDERAIFFTTDKTKEITNIGDYNSGYSAPKFINKTSAGVDGQDGTHPDTDFPMFRLADVYLMYAESVLRGGTGGDVGTALNYVNQLRERAYNNATGNITTAQLNLDFILDERARELMWEGHRRTDLIRYNQFTENGIWPWKGNIQAGRTTEKFRDLYPIPSTELISNPNLKQNTGY